MAEVVAALKTLTRAVWLSLVVLVLASDAHPQQPGQVAPPPTPARATPLRDPRAIKGTAVVKGQLLDALTGNPIRRARVTLSGQANSGAQTDTDGRFEIRDLPAGKYTFNTTAPGYLSLNLSNGGKPLPPLEVTAGATIEKVVLRLMKGGVIAGHVLDEFGDPILGAEVQALRYRYIEGRRELSPIGSFFMTARTDDLGAYRIYGLDPGDYYVSARARNESMFSGTAVPNTEGPAPTFYPGTADAGEARRVPVRAGRETLGIVFPMVVMRLASIRGRAVTSAGEPLAGGSISITQRVNTGGTSSSSRSVRPDGSFEIGSLPAGTYLLTTRLNNAREDDPGEMGRLLVSVNGEDLNEVLLVGQTGGIARGRVVTDEGIAPPFALGTLQLSVSSIDPRLPFVSRPPIRARDDWTFEFRGLFDRMQVRSVGGTGPQTSSMWTFKSVLLDGQDVTDSGIEFRPGQTVENIEMVYTRKVSRLSGTVRTEQGVSTDAFVVLFPADESRWVPQSRWMRLARPRDDGQYAIAPGPVPSDDYLIVAVTDLETGQWADPEFLKSVKPLAARVSVGEGETKVQNVTVVEWRR